MHNYNYVIHYKCDEWHKRKDNIWEHLQRALAHFSTLKKKHLSQDLKGESKLPRQGDCPSLLSTYYVPGTAPGIRIRERNYQQIFLKELSLLGVNRFPSDDLLGSDGIIFKMF